LGNSWLGTLLFSLVVSAIFSEVFSSLVGLGSWTGFILFLAVLASFLGMNMYVGRARDDENERIRQLARFKGLQAGDAPRDDEV
jgi:4-hydroxybenzoate polyprenyltransferase